jgi:hypothetical protein
MQSLFSSSLGEPLSKISTSTVPITASGNLGPLSSITGFTNALMSGISGGQNPSAPTGHLLDVLSRGDPVLGFEWTGYILDPSNPTPIPSVYIESIRAPGIQFELDHRFYQGRNLSYPAKIISDNMSIELYNDRSGRAAKLAASWSEDSFVNTNGNFRRPIDYKKTVVLEVHDIRHEKIYMMIFSGCFPSSMVIGGNYDYKSSDHLPVQLDLSVDTVHVTGA